MRGLTRRELIGILSVVIALYALYVVFVFYISNYGGGNPQPYEKSYQQYSPFNFVFFCWDAIARTWGLIHSGHDVLLVLFTTLIFVVTAALAKYTRLLWGATTDLVDRTELTTQIQERAYLYGGGPYGLLDTRYAGELSKGRQNASFYRPPWQMAILNYGRTPGTITKVEWGLVDIDRFPRNTKVTAILKDREKFLPKGTIKTVEHPNFICPPTGRDHGLNYRHVQFPERIPGQVFFARIDYEDIFGDDHYSTFKLLLTEHGHSDPIDGGYEDQDHTKPPKRRSR